jgi:GTP-binding protein HflX
VYVADKLFATLDPTTRKIDLPGGRSVLLTDTVGFIQKLPTSLVESFKATLEEIAEADLLLHVMDITHPYVEAHAEAVMETLEEIGAMHIPRINVLNKIDRIQNPSTALAGLEMEEAHVLVSARKMIGMDEVLEAINKGLYESLEEVNVMLPYEEGSLISQFHEQGWVDKIEHMRDGVTIRGRLPGRLLASFSPFMLTTSSAE